MNRLDGIAALLQRTDANLASVRRPSIAASASTSDISLEWQVFQRQNEQDRQTEMGELRAFLMLCDKKMSMMQEKYDETEKSLRSQVASACAGMERHVQPSESEEYRMMRDKLQALETNVQAFRVPDLSEEVKHNLARVLARVENLGDKVEYLQQSKREGDALVWRVEQLETQHRLQIDSVAHEDATTASLLERIGDLESEVVQVRRFGERALDRQDTLESRVHADEVKMDLLEDKCGALATNVRAEAQLLAKKFTEMHAESRSLVAQVAEKTESAQISGRQELEYTHARVAELELFQENMSEQFNALKDHIMSMMAKLHEKTDFSPRKFGESLTEALYARISEVEEKLRPTVYDGKLDTKRSDSFASSRSEHCESHLADDDARALVSRVEKVEVKLRGFTGDDARERILALENDMKQVSAGAALDLKMNQLNALECRVNEVEMKISKTPALESILERLAAFDCELETGSLTSRLEKIEHQIAEDVRQPTFENVKDVQHLANRLEKIEYQIAEDVRHPTFENVKDVQHLANRLEKIEHQIAEDVRQPTFENVEGVQHLINRVETVEFKVNDLSILDSTIKREDSTQDVLSRMKERLVNAPVMARDNERCPVAVADVSMEQMTKLQKDMEASMCHLRELSSECPKWIELERKFQGLEEKLACSSGPASMGFEDFSPEALQSLSARLDREVDSLNALCASISQRLDSSSHGEIAQPNSVSYASTSEPGSAGNKNIEFAHENATERICTRMDALEKYMQDDADRLHTLVDQVNDAQEKYSRIDALDAIVCTMEGRTTAELEECEQRLEARICSVEEWRTTEKSQGDNAWLVDKVEGGIHRILSNEQNISDIACTLEEQASKSVLQDSRIAELESFVKTDQLSCKVATLDERLQALAYGNEEVQRKFGCEAVELDARFTSLEDAISEIRAADELTVRDDLKVVEDKLEKLKIELPRRVDILEAQIPPKDRFVCMQEKMGLLTQENLTFRRRLQDFQSRIQNVLEHHPVETAIEEHPTSYRVRLLEEQKDQLREDLFHVERRILQVENSLVDLVVPARSCDNVNPIPVPESWFGSSAHSDVDSIFRRSDGGNKPNESGDDNANSVCDLFSPRSHADPVLYSECVSEPRDTQEEFPLASYRGQKTSCIPLHSPRSDESYASSGFPQDAERASLSGSRSSFSVLSRSNRTLQSIKARSSHAESPCYEHTMDTNREHMEHSDWYQSASAHECRSVASSPSVFVPAEPKADSTHNLEEPSPSYAWDSDSDIDLDRTHILPPPEPFLPQIHQPSIPDRKTSGSKTPSLQSHQSSIGPRKSQTSSSASLSLASPHSLPMDSLAHLEFDTRSDSLPLSMHASFPKSALSPIPCADELEDLFEEATRKL